MKYSRIRSACSTGLLASILVGCGSSAVQPTTSSGAPTTAAATTVPTTAAATVAPTTAAATVAPTTAAATTAPTTAAAPSATVKAEIKTFLFKPEPLEVKLGTQVTWTNLDDIDHSVTHGTPPDPGGTFDSDFFGKDKTFSYTFDQAGEFAYFCKRHNSMTGVVKVTQ